MLIGDSYLPPAELTRTAFYNEFGARQGMLGNVTLIVDDGQQSQTAPMTVMTLMRAPGMPAFTPDELRGYQALHPHLHRAVRTHWALAGLRDQRKALEGALDTLPQPLFVLASDGTIEHANPAARRLLDQPGVIQARHGRLQCVGRLEPGAVANTLRLSAWGMGQVLGTWWEEANGRTRTALLRFTPLPPASPYRAVWPHAAALLIVELLDGPGHASARLQATAQRYGLTPAEIRLFECLQRGLTPAEAAQHLGVRISTVRSQLASLLHKTGSRRQADLLRLNDPPVP
jgi:DNA-binding CsgD family transcriptional regulator